MKLIFERSVPGRGVSCLPACDVPKTAFPDGFERAQAPRLPQVSEGEISRHYTALSRQAFGVNSGFYPWVRAR